MLYKFRYWIYKKFFRQFVFDDIEGFGESLTSSFQKIERSLNVLMKRTDVAVGVDVCVGKDPGFIVIATRVGKECRVEIIDIHEPKNIMEWREIIEQLRQRFAPRERIDAPRSMKHLFDRRNYE